MIRWPAGVSCGSCLFVVVLSVLSLSLSRLSPWRGFLPRLTLPLALLRFVFIFLYVVVGSTLPTAPQHRLGFAHLEVISMVVSVFSLCLPSVCSVASYIQYLVPWLLCQTPFYTHNLSKYGLFQSLSQYGLFQNPGLNKTNVFASKPSFTQRAVLHKSCVIHK
jgi:hypothetical protein